MLMPELLDVRSAHDRPPVNPVASASRRSSASPANDMDPLAVGGDFQSVRPAGNVHLEGALRSGSGKSLDTLIVPGQERFSRDRHATHQDFPSKSKVAPNISST
jgi:hypothetical protein